MTDRGGGISAASKRFFLLLSTRTPLVATSRFNDGGIVGAALAAADAYPKTAVCPSTTSCRAGLGVELVLTRNVREM